MEADGILLLHITSERLKPNTHWVIHNRADRIFDRSPIGMIHWNVHVRFGVVPQSVLQSALQSANHSTDPYYCQI